MLATIPDYTGEFGPELDFGPENALFWNPLWFHPRYLRVTPKEGGQSVPFKLWSHQKLLAMASIRAMVENKYLLHVKPRKEGSSTFFTGILTQHTCFRRGCQSLILAQRDDVTTQLARTAVRFYNGIPAWMRPKRRERVERSIDIPTLDSVMSLATAGQDDPGRGFTGLQALLATEICKWKSPDTWTAVLNNLPQRGAFVVAESTPLHHGDELQRLWKDADNPDSRWSKVFVPWTMVEEYAMNPPPNWRPNEVVQTYADKFGISERQAYWMQVEGIPKCSNKLDKFAAEYPINDMDCWKSLGSTVFNEDKLQERLMELGANGMVEQSDDPRFFADPVEGHRYVIGVDPAGSFSKRDFFGVQCLDLAECNQAFEGALHGDAFQIARRLVELGTKYNMATIYVEANGVGEALLLCLVNMGYKRIYYRGKGKERKPGWWSDLKRKVEAYGIAQELLDDGSCSINSHRLLRHMQESQGPMADKNVRDSDGGHFDLVTAWCIALWAYKHEAVSSYNKRKADPKELARRTWDRWIAKLTRRESGGHTVQEKYGEHVIV